MAKPHALAAALCAATLFATPSSAHPLSQDKVPVGLTGELVKDVILKLEGEGFTDYVFVDTAGNKVSPPVETDIVVFIEPSPGRKVEPGAEVVLTATEKGLPTDVPDIEMTMLKPALALLAKAGLQGVVRKASESTGNFEEPNHEVRTWAWAVKSSDPNFQDLPVAKTGDQVKLKIARTNGKVTILPEQAIIDADDDVGIIITDIGYTTITAMVLVSVIIGGLLGIAGFLMGQRNR